MYFSSHKLAIEIDEKGYTDRNEKKKENEREEKIKEKIGCEFVKINLDKKLLGWVCWTWWNIKSHQ